MSKTLELLAAGAVKVTWTDGWKTRALVRDGRAIFKVVYSHGRWMCEGCGHDGCSHTQAVAGVVRVL